MTRQERDDSVSAGQLDLNADPQCLLKVQIGDHVWVDRTLYEVYGFDGPNALLRWSDPLRIRNIASDDK